MRAKESEIDTILFSFTHHQDKSHPGERFEKLFALSGDKTMTLSKVMCKYDDSSKTKFYRVTSNTSKQIRGKENDERMVKSKVSTFRSCEVLSQYIVCLFDGRVRFQ